jgi:hypothetical protein
MPVCELMATTAPERLKLLFCPRGLGRQLAPSWRSLPEIGQNSGSNRSTAAGEVLTINFWSHLRYQPAYNRLFKTLSSLIRFYLESL